jgi:hypothetical protein
MRFVSKVEEAIFDLMFRLGNMVSALRVAGRPHIQIVQRTGLMCNDYDFADSYLIKPDNKAAVCPDAA